MKKSIVITVIILLLAGGFYLLVKSPYVNAPRTHKSLRFGLEITYPAHFNLHEDESAINIFKSGAVFCSISSEKRDPKIAVAQIVKKRQESFYESAKKDTVSSEATLISDKKIEMGGKSGFESQFLYKMNRKDYVFTEYVLDSYDLIFFVDFYQLADDSGDSATRVTMLQSLKFVSKPTGIK